jgi:hypothetical protein
MQLCIASGAAEKEPGSLANLVYHSEFCGIRLIWCLLIWSFMVQVSLSMRNSSAADQYLTLHCFDKGIGVQVEVEVR